MHNAKARDLRHRQFLKVLNQYNTEVGKLGTQDHSSYKRLKKPYTYTHTRTHACYYALQLQPWKCSFRGEQ